MNQPILGITMGDPAGIGPEITVSACNNSEVTSLCHPLIVGDAEIIKRACLLKGLTDLQVLSLKNPSDAVWKDGFLNVLDLKNMDLACFQPGQINANCGKAAHEYIIVAADLAMQNVTAAVVTAPIHKEAIHLAGIKEPGHAEILARHTNTSDYGAMLVDGPLRVIHVSTHVSMRQAIELVNKERVLRLIQLAHRSMQRLGFEKPHIGVSGLNPHCGEGGLFGDEEIREIVPAVNQARALGIDVEGPLPGDTIFAKGRRGIFDVILAMYHDQGHIPIKDGFMFSSEEGGVSGVNITIGLPIIRTSVDHGTAFDIAWQGKADPSSLVAAIKLAVDFATGPNRSVNNV